MLGKLAQVDGPGSGLDADTLNGTNAGPTAEIAYRNLSAGDQRVMTHHYEAATPFTQPLQNAGTTTPSISLGPGSDLVTRVTYQVDLGGVWDVFVSTQPDGSGCRFRGVLTR